MVPKVICSGSSYAIGEEYGLQCHELIANCLSEIEELFGARLRMHPQLLFARAEEYFEPHIQKTAPHLWDELTGLADASQQPRAKILFLQAISEFVSGAYPENLLAVVDCTASENGATLVAANFDFLTDLMDKYLVVREIHQDNRPHLIMLALAGSLGFAGLNQIGLAAVSASLETSGVQKGLPATILIRLALERGSLADMVNFVIEAPRATARNYLLSNALTAINLETTISKVVQFCPSSTGALVHTNHYLADEFADIDLGLAKWPDSVDRYHRCVNLIQERLPLSVAEMSMVLSDHVNYPKGICRHECDTQKGAITGASIIITTAEPQLLVCRGNPCHGRFETFTFSME